jgi:hypothetical protein
MVGEKQQDMRRLMKQPLRTNKDGMGIPNILPTNSSGAMSAIQKFPTHPFRVRLIIQPPKSELNRPDQSAVAQSARKAAVPVLHKRCGATVCRLD